MDLLSNGIIKPRVLQFKVIGASMKYGTLLKITTSIKQ